VRIYFSDGSDIAAHNVRVWASVNGGKTWQAVQMSQSGPHWTAVVTNPAKAGYVSLRVQGTNAAGDTASVTTINAYAVSCVSHTRDRTRRPAPPCSTAPRVPWITERPARPLG
jgi:hypothetical protein